MFLPTVLTNRRKFLERSALGAGSILLAPLLLESCTDHAITPIQPVSPPTIPPILTDSDIDWNGDAKAVVITALQLVPEVGGFLGSLVGYLWPDSTPTPFDQLRAQMEALIDQKIADNVYKQVSDTLGKLTYDTNHKVIAMSGLVGDILLYQNELSNYNLSVDKYKADPTQPVPNPTNVNIQWLATRTVFVNNIGSFQEDGYQVLLLPLFAQFVNMYLGLLRDGVGNGKNWNWSAGDQQQVATDLTNAIKVYSEYAKFYYLLGRADMVNKTQRNDHLNEPFFSVNTYDRQMSLTVLDYMDLWTYYDATLYPHGTKLPDGTYKEVLTREIYSDPAGASYHSTNSGPLAVPEPAVAIPSNITIWASDRIDAVQVTYPVGGGPGGVTQTPRMGVQPGGKIAGGTELTHLINIKPSYPITKVRALTGSYPNGGGGTTGPFACAMQFQFYDTETTAIMGSLANADSTTVHDTGLFGYTSQALTSIYVHGANTDPIFGGADCAVFGFRHWNEPATNWRAIRNIYVTSPREDLAADLPNAFPNLGASASLITEELKAYRRAYWAYISALAKLK